MYLMISQVWRRICETEIEKVCLRIPFRFLFSFIQSLR